MADIATTDSVNSRQLRSQAQLIRNVNDNTTELIFMKDRVGRLIYANAATLRLMGKCEKDIGTADSALFHNMAEYHPIHANDLRVMETGESISVEEPYTGVDGACRIFRSTKSPLRDDAGQIIGVIGVSTDISTLKEAEQTLRDADHRKDEFLAMLAHELRNPLAAIRYAGQVLQCTDADAQTLRSAAEILNRQVAHMVRQVDDLLDVSRISRGSIELRKECTELAPIVRDAVEASRPLFARLDQQLTVTLPPSAMHVYGDPIRLAQIVGNLLNNASKFTDRGGRIWLTVQHEDEQAMIRVRDTGIGIPTHELSRIFDMFGQVDSSLERARDGLGLGLALVKNLVEMHGGTVGAASDGLGKGSEFVLRLPLVTGQPQPAALEQPVAARPVATAARRILIADDNQDSADMLRTLFEFMGHDVRTAADGLEAVEAAAMFHPDVVVLDIGMPRLNGYEAARRIREQQRGNGLTLIALSGWNREEDRQRSQREGFDAHLVKPVDLTALTMLLGESERD
ncbi:MAG TPA: ATP-binding protein [Vicinamibacterales bacterium]|nr:ATP-binding protein [Vicinamibacterales bacterium]